MTLYGLSEIYGDFYRTVVGTIDFCMNLRSGQFVSQSF